MLRKTYNSPLWYAAIGFVLTVGVMAMAPWTVGSLFESNGFDPHGHCFLWRRDILWLLVTSDSFIALSYMSISLTLIYFVWRSRREIPFHGMFIAFGTFIFACGVTHLVDIWVLWEPDYWLSGFVKLVTAVASVVTAILLPPLVPRAMNLITDAKSARFHRVQIEKTNRDLQHEIHERREAEAEIRKLNDLLQEQITRLKMANQELEAFSYSVSHDLRNPLRAINGFSQTLIEDYEAVLDQEGKRHLNRIKGASQRMGELIDDLLKLSRLARTELRTETVYLSQIAEEVIQQQRDLTPERQVEVQIQPDMILAEGDSRLLRAALENLFNNAWKFTRDQAHPRIEFSQQPDGTYLIRDNGVGFEMQYASKLFMPFQRLHDTFEGTGIGLAIVQRIIQMHGGRIWAESEPEKGSTFFFTLPTG